ncbi:hypothetical protein ONZ43_g7455 [Nemania bipapillata]|uniref:Uncharacterized protein n=1 Tax=Nemania bipapillata TaxID=110536 RepID=A0ACC2HS53_9PEZI|nr:hypothetical protein ONZ43_g7455 [Nemania bipapillata]
MTSRLSSYADRRTNGTADSDGNPRPRAAAGSSGTPYASADSRSGRSSQAGFTNPAHKRSASGNPRPANRTVEERRTERLTVTTREKLVSRIRSPERRPKEPAQPEKDRRRPKETPKARQPETRLRETKAEPLPTWDPVATLIPHSTAPLATRVSVPPLASEAPSSQQPQPLHELSLEEQEAVVIEDLLFVFMGYEGQYIRYAYGYNPSDERDRLQGPAFKILPGLDPSLQDLTLSMLQMATHHSALEMFVNVQSREEFGIVNHALSRDPISDK